MSISLWTLQRQSLQHKQMKCSLLYARLPLCIFFETFREDWIPKKKCAWPTSTTIQKSLWLSARHRQVSSSWRIILEFKASRKSAFVSAGLKMQKFPLPQVFPLVDFHCIPAAFLWWCHCRSQFNERFSTLTLYADHRGVGQKNTL